MDSEKEHKPVKAYKPNAGSNAVRHVCEDALGFSNNIEAIKGILKKQLP